VAKGEQYLHFAILILNSFVEIDYNIFKLVIQTCNSWWEIEYFNPHLIYIYILFVIDNECQKPPKL